MTLVSALALAAPCVASAQDVGDQIIVKRTANLSAAQNADVRSDAQVTLLSSLPIADVQVVAAADGDRDRALGELRADPRVQWAEADAMRYAADSDPLFKFQWALSNTGQVVNNRASTAGDDISALAAWGMSRGAGVTVGVVDSGAQLDHPDLQLVAGYDYVADDDTPSDGSGHGTQVAGIVAAANNTLGSTGTAPDARVMPLKILDSTNSGNSSTSATALADAGDLGLRVVNASYGWTQFSNAEETAIRQHPNTLYVVAAGNSSKNVDVNAVYPCAYNDANVLCVGASDQNDARAVVDPNNPSSSLSNYGPTGVDLFAPGMNIATASRLSKYVYVSGTSMAAPMVSAAAAMLFSYNPGLTVDQVKQALISSADHPAALSGLSVSGGRLNAAAALRAVGATDPPPPAAEPEDPAPADDDPADDADDAGDDTFDDGDPSGDASEPLTLSAVSLDGPVVVCAKKCHSKPAALRFKLSARAAVVVSLAHRACPHVHDCTYSWAAKRTVKGRAGVQRMTVARTVAGMRLHAGRWRLTLAVAHTRRSVHFTVRRGR
jgi:subtilase family protein